MASNVQRSAAPYPPISTTTPAAANLSTLQSMAFTQTLSASVHHNSITVNPSPIQDRTSTGGENDVVSSQTFGISTMWASEMTTSSNVSGSEEGSRSTSRDGLTSSNIESEGISLPRGSATTLEASETTPLVLDRAVSLIPSEILTPGTEMVQTSFGTEATARSWISGTSSMAVSSEATPALRLASSTLTSSTLTSMQPVTSSPPSVTLTSPLQLVSSTTANGSAVSE
ncbi:hypothetical protein ACOMHN_038541 [Nucella lapillus]